LFLYVALYFAHIVEFPKGKGKLGFKI
jgi:hypothetical protein